MPSARSGDKHPSWKGDKVGYSGIHLWVATYWGRESKCEKCKTTTAKRYEWANLGILNRERKNWKRLCKKCHVKLDDVHTKIWLSRKRNQPRTIQCRVCNKLREMKACLLKLPGRGQFCSVTCNGKARKLIKYGIIRGNKPVFRKSKIAL